ncbi:hypothetical protein MACJ_002948 [Theileria orientalis]|uniref:PH domain-containing protein n=1 Tax=Theileria orientalis TaxID=68886 RepID=A0A976M6T3_THEOR|nr:hypothetical protein MACJ_002948 [Theileria orientalis]
MEPNNSHTQALARPDFPWLPRECNFTMQQWLYRRTLHTKRYKKRYVVLHNERLYTFTKLPSFDKFDAQNLHNLLKLASNSWILTGAIVSADPDINNGLYRWKIQFKNYKKPVSGTEMLNKFLSDKPDLNIKYVDNLDSIFDDVTSSVLENKNTNTEVHDCIWFATTNHKIASDWVVALIHTSRYGSLYNLIYKNPSRRRYQQFKLPWFLMALDYMPNLSKDENSKQPLTSFTYIKIDIHKVFDFPMLPNAKIYCAVEFNSSFYILQLYRYESENSTSTPTGVPKEDDPHSTLNYYVNKNTDYGITRLGSDDHSSYSVNRERVTYNPDTYGVNYKRISSIGPINEDVHKRMPLNSVLSSSASVANSLSNLYDEDSQNVLTRLLNLNPNEDIENKQVAEKRSIVYKDACVYVPVYKNTTQEVVWLHFFGDFDIYMGTASIRDVDFGSRDPAPVKTCMIKLLESLNPLSYRRVDISAYKGESTVLKKSTAQTISNDRGFVEVSVIIPKHLGNFLDPVTISHGSPKEYLANATRSPITVGIQMLISNIKRVRQSFTVLKDIIHSLKSVLEFRNRISSFMAMLYFILVFGIFPNRMLIIFLLPLIVYILCTHPSFIDLTFVFLLKFPILIAILPKRLIHPFLLIPKTSCILCSKKPSFLEKNAQIVDPDMVTKVEISSRTFHYTSSKKMHPTKSLYSHSSKIEVEHSDLPDVITNPFSAANAIQINTGSGENNQSSDGNPTESPDKNKENTDNYVDFEKRISVHLNSLPMITSKHLLNDSIEITRYKGTRIETCKHRGIIMSYLSTMFINEMGVSLFDSVQGDGLSIIKGYHDIYYNTPPYRHVPFWANVKFTVYFFMYMLYLTFFGGISNQQLLHLLHRNKLMCRLTLESTGVADPKSKVQNTTSKPKTDTMYENERRILFGRFSKMNLRFYERGIFSTEDGKFISVDLSKHVIRLVVNETTDSEGWTYAKNWNSPFSREPTSMSFVRRRKWLLTPKENKSSEYVVKGECSSKLTSDYFTNMNDIHAKSKIALDQDNMSVSSLDSCASPKPSNPHLKNLSPEVVASEETADCEPDHHNDHERTTMHITRDQGEMNHSAVTNIDHLGREDNTERLEMTIEPDENVARLYMRRGKLRGMMDKFRDMRERRRSQKQDNSEMQEYLSTLVSNEPSFGQNLPRRLQILKRFREARKAQSSKMSVTSDTSHTILDESDTASLYSTSKFPRADLYSIGVSPISGKAENNLIASLMNLNKIPTIEEDDDASRSTTQRNSGADESILELRSDSSHLNQAINIEEVFTPQPPYSKLALKRSQRDQKGMQFPTLQSLSSVPSSSEIYTSKIARLVGYLKNLYKPEDRLDTDRGSYSTISQLSTESNESTTSKSKFRRMIETVFVILFVLPVCVVLDLGKLLVGLFWVSINTLMGIQEPEQLKSPTLTDRVPKRRAKCKILKSKDWVRFKLAKPRRCFLLGDRLKAYKKICRAENISLVHSMNKLMFDSSQKYEYESDVSSEAESDSSLMTMREGEMEKSYSNQYVDDSDVLVESDLGSTNRDELMTDDDFDELKTMSMNPFDLEDSDEEILNMMRRSYDSNEPEIEPKKGKKKKGKIVNYISTIYFKRMAKKGKYIDEQHLSDYEHDSDDNTKNDNKLGLIAMLKKVKDQIVMANYKINLYNMRFEKFLNMFSWKNYSVTTIVLVLLLLVIFLNLLFRIEIVMLAYILIQFKSGYRRGMWERIILSTTERHINKAIVDLEIFRPFWDLSTHQIQMLSNRIKSFSSIELDINTIREAKDELHLSHIVTDRLIATKFAKNWRRYRWINHLFRQAPCKQY